MEPSESQVDEYKQRAGARVQSWLDDEVGDQFSRTCGRCNTPLRDDSITGGRVVFIVTTLGAFMEHDSQVHYRCPNHSSDVEGLVERLLTSRAVALSGIVRESSGSLEFDVQDAEFHN